MSSEAEIRPFRAGVPDEAIVDLGKSPSLFAIEIRAAFKSLC
jgi:hypothetical protein